MEYFSYPHHVLNEEVTTTSDPCIKDPLLEPDDPNYVGYIDVPAYCVEIYGKANLVVGESTELQCWGYAQRNPMIGQPAWPVSANRPRTWSTQNATEVTVNTQTNFWKNTIQGVAPGATRILCSIDGKVGAIKVTVSAPAPTLTEVRVEGPTGGNAHGLSMPFTTKLTARAVYSNGTTEVVNNTATWQSTEPSVATVAAGGYMTVNQWGWSTYVTATYQGMTSAPRQVHYSYILTHTCVNYGVPC